MSVSPDSPDHRQSVGSGAIEPRVEFAEYNAYRRYHFTGMERICRDWDGADPIRTTLPTPPGR